MQLISVQKCPAGKIPGSPGKHQHPMPEQDRSRHPRGAATDSAGTQHKVTTRLHNKRRTHLCLHGAVAVLSILLFAGLGCAMDKKSQIQMQDARTTTARNKCGKRASLDCLHANIMKDHKIKELQHKLRQQKSDSRAADKKVKHLSGKKRKSDETIANLKQTIMILNENIGLRLRECSFFKKKISGLIRENIKLEANQPKELRDRVDFLAPENKKLTKVIKKLQVRVDSLTQENGKLTKVIENLQNIDLVKTIIKDLKCPISHDYFNDPVTTVDGHTYECAAIEEWFRQKICKHCKRVCGKENVCTRFGEPTAGRMTDPITNVRLETTDLQPNHLVKSLVNTLRENGFLSSDE